MDVRRTDRMTYSTDWEQNILSLSNDQVSDWPKIWLTGYNTNDVCTGSNGPGAANFRFLVGDTVTDTADRSTALGCDYYENLLRYTNYEIGNLLYF